MLLPDNQDTTYTPHQHQQTHYTPSLLTHAPSPTPTLAAHRMLTVCLTPHQRHILMCTSASVQVGSTTPQQMPPPRPHLCSPVPSVKTLMSALIPLQLVGLVLTNAQIWMGVTSATAPQDTHQM